MFVLRKHTIKGYEMNKIEVANFSSANPTFKAVVEFIDNKPTIIKRFGFEPDEFLDRVAIESAIRLRVNKHRKINTVTKKVAHGVNHG